MKVQVFKHDHDIKQANIWQYDNADPYLSILSQKDDWYSEYFGTFWTNWTNSVFRLEINYDPSSMTHVHTSLFGCVIWATILDFPLEPILVPREGIKMPWSFENINATIIPGTSRENFGIVEDPAISTLGGNFTPATASAALTMLEKVQLLKLSYYKNIGNNSVPFTNSALADVFRINGQLNKAEDGTPAPITQTPYVLDTGDMVITYVFPYALSDQMKTALITWDVMPKPAGVSIVMQYP
jgi:Protein of unknown function (DUF2612)